MSDVAQGPSVAQARAFVLQHRVRLIAGAILAVALVICFTSALEIRLAAWLLLGPLMVGAVVAVASQPEWSDQVNGWNASFEAGKAKTEGKTGKYARFFQRPLYGGSLALWRSSDPIGDPHAKAAVRVGGIAYLWSVMILVLVLAVWLIVSLIVAAIVLSIVGWFMGWHRGAVSSAASEAVVGRFGKRVTSGLFRTGDTKIDEKGNVIKEGVLLDTQVARIDKDGTIYKPGLLGEEKTGRMDEDGNVYRDTGMLAEEWTGQLDADGRVVDGDPELGQPEKT